MADTSDNQQLDRWLSFFVLLFATLLFGMLIWRMLPLFQPKLDQPIWSQSGHHYHLSFQACMPLYGQEPGREKYGIRREVRRWITQSVKALRPERSLGDWRLNSMQLQGHAAGDRCQDVHVDLTLQPTVRGQVGGQTGSLFGEGRILWVAARSQLAGISAYDTKHGVWHGIMVDYIRNMNRALQPTREVRFIPVKHVGALMDAIRFGVADLGYGRLSFTAERNEKLFLGHSYFKTGIMLGSLEREDATKLQQNRDINNGRIKLVVTENTTSSELAKTRFPRAVLHQVRNSGEIPEKVRWLRERFTSPINRILFMVDETEALTWPQSERVVVNDQPLLSEEGYVMASWRAALQQATDAYIAKNPIRDLYIEALTQVSRMKE
uniref:Uncharacterized protein n=1 Tax=Magnetococcus massalia (strain MO-1) TaxID=451514 RepID=A0A1S7LPZ0_MAGMO|nr:Conserved protein of unknown function [Candidatus Magnetococcus massalia]